MTTPRITIHGYDFPEENINSTESLFSMISTLQSISQTLPTTSSFTAPSIYIQSSSPIPPSQEYTIPTINSSFSIFVIGEDIVFPEQESIRRPIELNISSQPYSKENMGETCDSCIICSEEYIEGVDVTTLDCSHTFHTSCIKEWGCYKQDCPICRTNIPHFSQIE